MATISFKGEREIWLATRWIFENFLEHTRAGLADAAALAAIDQGLAFEGVNLAALDGDVAHTLADAMVTVARAVEEGRVVAANDGRELDDASQAQFRTKVAELALMLQRFAGGGGAVPAQ